jgi:RNA polymerase sigma factor (sigma-70 family)
MDATHPSPPDPQRATPEQLLAHAASVRKLARALVGDASAADDVVQDTWLAALRRPPHARESIGPWLARVVRNIARDRRRSTGRRLDHERLAYLEREPSAPDDVAGALEAGRAVLDALEQLRDPLRSTLVRSYLQGFSVAEIAVRDGIAERTVRWRVTQGLEALRTQLDQGHGGERKAWMLLVAPLTRRPDVPATLAATTSAAGAAIWMHMSLSTLAKLGLAAAIAIVAVGYSALAVLPTRTPAVSEPSEPRPAAVETARESDSAPPLEPAERVALAPDASSSTLVAFAVPPAQAVVEAQIVDELDRPIAGATLQCKRLRDVEREDRRPTPSAKSDARGFVRIVLHAEDRACFGDLDQDLSPHAWRSTMQAEASGTAVRELEAACCLGEVTSLGKLVLMPAGDVIGRVIDADGNPLSDVEVRLVTPSLSSLPSKTGVRNATTRTAADGSLALRRMPVGSFRLHAQPETALAAASDVFEIRAGADLQVPDLICRPDPHAIEGIVLTSDDTPCASARVDAFAPGLDRRHTRTRADGRFALRANVGSVVDLQAVGCDGCERATGIAAGTKDLVLRLRPDVEIEVLVETNAGTPLTRYELGWSMDGTGSSSVRDREGGRARIRVPSKPLTLWVDADGFEVGRMADLDPVRAPQPIRFALAPLPTLLVRVTRAGAPVPHAQVVLARVLDQPSHAVINGFQSRPLDPIGGGNADGAGRVALTCRDEGRFRLLAIGMGSARAESDELLLGPRMTSREIELELAAGGALEGRVLTDADDSSRARHVTLSRGDVWTPSAPIGTDGSFRFEDVMPGTWELRRTLASFGGNSVMRSGALPDPTIVQVTIVAGETTRFDLDLRGRAAPVLDGRLTLGELDLRTWTAQLEVPNGPEHSVDVSALGSDGMFRLALALPGRATLELASPASPELQTKVTASLELGFGANAWQLDLPTGTLVIETQASDSRALELVTRCANGATCTTSFRARAGAPMRLAHVAAGAAQIIDAASRAVLSEVDLARGAETRLTLP